MHGLADLQRTRVGAFLPDDHPEERRLAGAVGANHADNPATRQREIEPVDQQFVAVPLLEAPGFDDDIPEPWTGSNVDFGGFDSLGRFLSQQVFICVEARLAFGLPRAR